MLDLSAGSAGGWFQQGNVPKTGWAEDPDDEFYESACAFFDSADIGRGIVVCGGQMADGYEDTTHAMILSGSGESLWMPLPSLALQHGRARHACAVIGNIVHVVGGVGINDDSAMGNMEFLDFSDLARGGLARSRANARLP